MDAIDLDARCILRRWEILRERAHDTCSPQNGYPRVLAVNVAFFYLKPPAMERIEMLGALIVTQTINPMSLAGGN
jgi:hypothetical protein